MPFFVKKSCCIWFLKVVTSKELLKTKFVGYFFFDLKVGSKRISGFSVKNRRLRKNYNKFVKAWNKCQNFFSEYKFQKRWRELLTGFLAAKKYLKRALRQVVTSWALCHTSRSFNAGIQSIQRIEDYNSLIKRLVKSSATLFELDTHIQSLLNKEENLNSMNNQIKIQQWITIDEGQDENGEDDEDYEDMILNSDKAMFHIGLIPDRWYNEKFPDFQEEPAIAIYSEKNTVNPTLLHEIHHTQAFSETAKQNLSHKAKYNQGFGYVKKAIRLALEIGCTDELNGMLQRWIREKENETRSRQLEIDKENLPNISNPYQTRIKGAPRKHIKNALEDNQKQKLSGSASTQRSQILSYRRVWTERGHVRDNQKKLQTSKMYNTAVKALDIMHVGANLKRI
ncbi:hypothetical protein GLOIN_2v1489218 [Rhizophagus irregularis DAOM 181602=DAOM 197198]|uniref:Uncharacterized protein n=1 Tax=Rhizophagus irregularis (strain DAOM 181602 / DAOM 197198 / MUCL 43194) TaxID=747089 RepID=A0A2P4NWU5_RHIID|nr:hypothetical protein GLOIN_2v1489218 [Rhizophagus irregularis DAOM 181602=DAOM 197198]POG57621.1 hypothetical protein GLOIN_2v1489218 [Rhizophagus irregularis DAOM 181602=DAOM 197198]|eukprot:XP_025164487.1 hypothetical protein GLOIN_2v1489218 [Rhizophagus irregularis DAOM 181602=DAOM 197198]